MLGEVVVRAVLMAEMLMVFRYSENPCNSVQTLSLIMLRLRSLILHSGSIVISVADVASQVSTYQAGLSRVTLVPDSIACRLVDYVVIYHPGQ